MSPKKVWKGAAGLRKHLVDVATIEAHPSNPRRGNVAEIAQSLERWGQTKPILTDGRYIMGCPSSSRARMAK